ncbi:TPA: hypothetical protein TZS81_002013 [Streptococcus suis]|nr:hypothetical protein [Streptococcus suis]HEL2396868.1 hypothetical protein [Streptococcus suis]HEL9618571.1 hypothetical protein [Streptococcus suis]HEL9649773.1 hypothetical protein [Streptococcus suis]
MLETFFEILRTIWKLIFYVLVVIGLIVTFLIWKGLDARSNAGREAARHQATMRKLEISDGREPVTYLVKGTKEIPNNMKYDTSKWMGEIYKFNDYYGINAEVHSLEPYVGQHDEVYIFSDNIRGVAYVLDTSGYVWGYFNKNFVEPTTNADDFDKVYDANELWKGVMLKDEARASTSWYTIEEGKMPFNKREYFVGIENRNIPSEKLKEYGTLRVTYPDSGEEEVLAIYTFSGTAYIANTEGFLVGQSVGIGDDDWESWASTQGTTYRINGMINLRNLDMLIYKR